MMLTICGNQTKQFCDGFSRRNFLQVGALGFGGLGLPQLLRAEQNGSGRSNKSVIMVYLPGGPPHQDMYDLKSDAPAEIRGEFQAIATNVPGIQICEHLPRLAKLADKYAIIRSLVGAKDRHESFQCMTGRLNERNPPGGWPEIGSVISKLQGTPHPTLASYVNLSPRMRHTPYNFGKPSFLGVGHTPFMPLGAIKNDMVLNGITTDRLADRKSLLTSIDHFRRQADNNGAMNGLDAFQQRAFELLTSGEMLRALDISSEDAKVRERYGKGTEKEQGDAANPEFSTRYSWNGGGAGDFYTQLPDWSTGRSLGNDRRGFHFSKGEWVKLDQEVVLNTPGKKDGLLRIWVDGHLRYEKSNVVFREAQGPTSEAQIAGVLSEIVMPGDKPGDKHKIWLSPFELRWP